MNSIFLDRGQSFLSSGKIRHKCGRDMSSLDCFVGLVVRLTSAHRNGAVGFWWPSVESCCQVKVSVERNYHAYTIEETEGSLLLPSLLPVVQLSTFTAITRIFT